MEIGKIHGFDWDTANQEKIFKKHGLPVGAIERMFKGRFYFGPDLKHSTREQRFHAVQRDASHPIFAIFTIRERSGKRYIRVISARYMHQKEIDRYEKEIT